MHLARHRKISRELTKESKRISAVLYGSCTSHASLGVCVILLRTETELESMLFIGGLASMIGYGRVKKDIEESKKR
jgi:hypothetical protein